MYCRNCGKEIDENAFICVHCGSLVNGGRVKTFRRHSNAIGIASIIAGILALALSLSCFFKDISSVGMYTNFYERFNYAIGFILIPFIFMIVSLVLSLKKKNNKTSTNTKRKGTRLGDIRSIYKIKGYK